MIILKKLINNNIFFWFIFLILLINIGSKIYSYRAEYSSKYDPAYWKQRYLKSQWVTTPGCGDLDPHINPKTCVWDDTWYANHAKLNIYKKFESLGDDGLYAYAGWEYIQGKDPSLLNAEMPPFGKYLIGLSILIFNNQNIFALFSIILVLISYFLLNLQVFKNKLIAILPIVLFSFEPLFLTQMRAPFLDLLYLSLLFFTLYFFLRKNFIIFAISLGLMMATKASSSTFVLVTVTCLSYFFIRKEFKLIKKFLLFQPIVFLTFTLTYFRFFLLGHSFRNFLGVQKWILNFYSTGAKGNLISVWDMIILGKWPTWWNETVKVDEWQIFWPITLLLSIIFILINIKVKKFDENLIFVLWLIIYIIFLSVIPVFPRYLLLALPFMYNLSIWVLLKNILKRSS